MRHISINIKRAASQKRETERGELMKYFCDRLNPDRVRDGYPKISIGRMGKLFQDIPTKDLYYLKRVCDDAKNFSKKFWWEMNPSKHTDEDKNEPNKKFKVQ
jgi:hypothetical protein